MIPFIQFIGRITLIGIYIPIEGAFFAYALVMTMRIIIFSAANLLFNIGYRSRNSIISRLLSVYRCNRKKTIKCMRRNDTMTVANDEGVSCPTPFITAGLIEKLRLTSV